MAWAAAGVTVVVVAVGAGVAVGAAGGDEEPRTRVTGGGASRFPSDSAQSWVTYADHLAVIKVQSEREQASASDHPGEGMVGRVVTVDVAKPLWSRAGAPTAPTTAEFSSYGWTLHDGKRTPFVSSGGPRVEVGNAYVAALVRLKSGYWVPLANDAVIPYEGEVLGRGEQKGGVDPGSLRERFDGRPAQDLVDELASAKPDPLAVGIATNDPEARWNAHVARVTERQATIRPAERPL